MARVYKMVKKEKLQMGKVITSLTMMARLLNWMKVSRSSCKEEYRRGKRKIVRTNEDVHNTGDRANDLVEGWADRHENKM